MFKRFTILALLSVLLLSAKVFTKTYTFAISDQAIAGNTQLKPGEYHIKLDGAQVVLTDKSGSRIDTTAKVETTERKFTDTAVLTSKESGGDRILYIELGGSSNRVVFE
jgi:hypothetical protein